MPSIHLILRRLLPLAAMLVAALPLAVAAQALEEGKN
jgi:hypothetical protein